MTEQAQEPSLDELQTALGPGFELVRLLGRGSMASVYLAREVGLGRLVAIKVLSSEQCKDETNRRRFEREARAAASLTHAAIVQIYQQGRLPNEVPYLVMQYIEGRTMEDRLAGEGPLPVELARRVLLSVATALAAAHAKGIVHRDIRPENILWDDVEQDARLSDFGIAAIVSYGAGEVEKLTKTGELVGDLRYMSPELVLDGDVSTMSDIYSFGVLGYELLTGEGPYEARAPTAIMSMHLSADPPRDLRALRPEVDAALAEILRRCLNREPKQRPRAADLVRMLEGQQTGASSSLAIDDDIDPSSFKALLRRRIPQIVGPVLGVGVAIIGVADAFRDNYQWPQWTFDLTLVLVACMLAGATVLAWFHGERGKQQSPRMQWVLLGAIAVIWLAVSVTIFALA